MTYRGRTLPRHQVVGGPKSISRRNGDKPKGDAARPLACSTSSRGPCGEPAGAIFANSPPESVSQSVNLHKRGTYKKRRNNDLQSQSPEVQSPEIQCPEIQKSSVQKTSVQKTNVQKSKCPESQGSKFSHHTISPSTLHPPNTRCKSTK